MVIVKRILRLLGLLILALVAVLAVRTLTFRSRQLVVAGAVPDAAPVDVAAAAARLGRAVQFPTVSTDDPAGRDPAPFLGLHAHLSESFPRTHAALAREVVDGRSLLYTWRGTDAALAPVVLMGHMDVVPVEQKVGAAAGGTGWTEPPFSGRVQGGFIWGRGTLDDKVAVLSILEAVESLLAQSPGARPQRTVYLAFSHDEEVEGSSARLMAEMIKQRGPAPLMVLDEGMVITQGLVMGVSRPVALVGTAQKGYLTVELLAQGQGGHSSMPPAHSAVGAVAAAVERLEAHQLAPHLSGPANELFDFAGPEMALPLRLVMANRWLLGPVMKSILLSGPSTAAILRTTTAATMIQGGVKENVLPQSARAVVNFRIVPGDSVKSVLEHVQATVADSSITVKVLGAPIEPSRPADPGSPQFQILARSLREIEPETVVAPALMLGYADAHHYESMTPDVFRFLPVRLRSEDLARIHGTDERVSLEDYGRCIRFYAQLLRNTALTAPAK